MTGAIWSQQALGALGATDRPAPLNGAASDVDGSALSPLARVAREAWLYAVPLVEVCDVRRRILARGPANQWVHNRHLTNVETQRVTSPNNDTLYSRAALDLRHGPVTIILPPTGTRYFSVQLVDMYSNNVAVLGTRTTGGDGGRFTIAGRNTTAPDDAIRAPSNWLFILARTLVDGPDDLAAANAVQDGLAIEGASGGPFNLAVPTRNDDWQSFFGAVGGLLRDSPPPATDNALFARIAAVGLRRDGFAAPNLSAAQIAEVEGGIAAARHYVGQTQLGQRIVDGWAYPPWNLGRFEQDYGFRAQIAVSGLFALPLEEAFYTRSVGDRSDGLFHGDNFHMRFAADQMPPVDGFWSMTCYEARPDGQFFFAANSIDRYAIGNRTRGLRRGADGSLDIWISRNDPGGARSANWLPAPADKPFALSMRAYLPKKPLLTGRYSFPELRHFV
ncbi:MAG: DUF1254 domain-containing protein [Sphingomonadaceae bacterium]|nr:DUF1254 domain-containing protein [Sphingomonadaceae bacterium]